jgi:H+/Cl- antiporter ClcA
VPQVRYVWKHDGVFVDTMSSQALVSNESTDGGTPSAVSVFAIVREVICCAIWTYAISNTFFTDIDSLIFQYAPAPVAWIWKFKALLFLGLLAALIAVAGRKAFAFFVLYLAFYPLVLIFWRLPRLLITIGSWSFALGLLNTLVSFFYDLRHKVISLFLFSLLLQL